MELSFRVNKSSDFIFDYLTDMEKFVSVHPVITKMNSLGNNTYKVYETLKFGFIPVSFTYPATVEGITSDKVVIIKATVMKLTKIEMRFILSGYKNGTLIEEKIKFSSPLPVKPIMRGIFRKQHTLLFKNIEDL